MPLCLYSGPFMCSGLTELVRRRGSRAGLGMRAGRSKGGVAIVAAVSSVGESWTSPGETWQVNALGTVNLVEALLAAQPSARLLFASTKSSSYAARRGDA